MNSTANSQFRFQINLVKSIKSALLGLASLAVLFAAMSYAQPASAQMRRAFYARTNGNCLQVRTSPSIYAPVAYCASNGARLGRVVGYRNGFARLSNGYFVSSNWIGRRGTTSNLGIGGRQVLSFGSTGGAVSAVQRRLGVSTTGTGYFGTTTRNAVINFQLANGLTPDGIVGPSTGRALGFF